MRTALMWVVLGLCYLFTFSYGKQWMETLTFSSLKQPYSYVFFVLYMFEHGDIVHFGMNMFWFALIVGLTLNESDKTFRNVLIFSLLIVSLFDYVDYEVFGGSLGIGFSSVITSMGVFFYLKTNIGMVVNSKLNIKNLFKVMPIGFMVILVLLTSFNIHFIGIISGIIIVSFLPIWRVSKWYL